MLLYSLPYFFKLKRERQITSPFSVRLPERFRLCGVAPSVLLCFAAFQSSVKTRSSLPESFTSGSTFPPFTSSVLPCLGKSLSHPSSFNILFYSIYTLSHIQNLFVNLIIFLTRQLPAHCRICLHVISFFLPLAVILFAAEAFSAAVTIAAAIFPAAASAAFVSVMLLRLHRSIIPHDYSLLGKHL